MVDQLEDAKDNRKTIIFAGLTALGLLVIALILLNLAQCSTSNTTSLPDAGKIKEHTVGPASKELTPPVATTEETPGEIETFVDDVQVQRSAGSEPTISKESKIEPGPPEPPSSYQAPEPSKPKRNVVQSPPAPPASENVEEPKPQRWVEDTEQVWVVDTPAWSEQIPIYSTVEVSICNVCGADITGNTAAHGKEHMLAGEGSGHHSEVRQNITGYDTVEYPEVGHWETRVVGGHWE